ncbi:MAG: two pore domain potassium channel family protein [Methanocalculus sp. MSAO_Arc1]|uniref:potassium channel family protein n=1 Tax=Methanocalculus TaxID=71151 RepID=UPI000FF56BF8|nr:MULTISPECIES: potassium channel family protein [unclassified Methanocalculus]MCP1662008.1 hypothetical protein [Methanocalculus sp. AMF5]RQD79625.1 MAG: two pore domain potassium channel family protein [Methanocalculus sp. MSAO_Arc1]
MGTDDQRFRLYLGILLLVFLVGSLGLAALEGLSLFEAVYFIIVTIATVGYGDIVPKTDAGRTLVLLLILAGVGTFLTVIAYIIDMTVSRSNQQARKKKIGMLIGVFFSELGVPCIYRLKDAVPSVLSGRDDLLIGDDWDARRFGAARKSLLGMECRCELGKIDLVALEQFLSRKRGVMIQLLQHPMLFEDEPFAEMITALSHFGDELSARRDLRDLSEPDLMHLSRDCERVVLHLLIGWLDYMEYLKNHYPYLFSLSVRTNPFDPHASAEIAS